MAIPQGSSRRLLLFIGLGTIVVLYFIFRGSNPTSTQPENATVFLAKVMTASGGQGNYNNIHRISFNKDFNLYAEDGSVELSRKEKHIYDFTNSTNRLISWRVDGVAYQLVENDTALFQTRDNIIDTTITKKQLQDKLNASTFVLGLPYTLENSRATKKYNGILSIENQPAHELEVTFKNSPDVWYMYYAQDSLDWLGYWVTTADHYSLVLNEEIIEVNGFKFPRKRKSYRTDAQKNRLYLRADYEYYNFTIN